ncbi:peptidoglycan DD-metalloendopeptidase family protein [Mucilaginibacter myungsuensis]|uniref:Peptidoglycan DD-metalloendopeptidase family protein n=1 Tax=Mucilaginibacter myungsuensis TaxID=649104 RepID=A0A929PXX8_9SPHI|nr:peptidoglycan DD-metalloendopeptidase family protein [Mucilaginibacter myungsuensis]MBE9662870.1 peptidoglycan DD-metalloendopeptidase family protein [Mucilaginibacter myungsuensis]MDN3598290.1 peptidoglycan DD-metalloendopeptidase family protein [Mucilaginibacter myungsuensis]
MKNILCLVLFLTGFTTAYAQTEKPANKTVGDNFEKFFNADDVQGIFDMYSPATAVALPLPKTTEFIKGLRAQMGKISKREFVGYTNSYATYKTTFEKGILALRLSVDNEGKVNGMFAGPYVDNSGPKLERNTTKLSLPFKGEWFVVWGGDTKEQNYHVESRAQKNAFDLLIKGQTGKSFKTDGKTNEDFYAFGQPILAPSAGEVVLVVDGVKDNKPGKMNPIYVPGNTVVIKTAANEYLFFAHFKQNTIKVKQGDVVKTGTTLGLCGNSGNSSEPHLHFHIQNLEDMTEATGVKSYFDNIVVSGQPKTDYSPVQNELIRNKEK